MMSSTSSGVWPLMTSIIGRLRDGFLTFVVSQILIALVCPDHLMLIVMLDLLDHLEESLVERVAFRRITDCESEWFGRRVNRPLGQTARWKAILALSAG